MCGHLLFPFANIVSFNFFNLLIYIIRGIMNIEVGVLYEKSCEEKKEEQ